jgi:dihydropteroate synthase
MGILNVTPDSFFDGGRLQGANGIGVDCDKALIKAAKFVSQGAAVIDVGGESTRPGATPISLEEELNRVLPVIERLAANLDVIISVDTSQPVVMSEAAKLGAGLINDVRALRLEGAITAAAQTQLPVCLMHMQGDPTTMQHNPCYTRCVDEVYEFLQSRYDSCVASGIPGDKIIVDPGIGFGKSDEDNLELIKKLARFKHLGAGVLFGVSRKSMIGRLLGRELPDRLAGSLGFAMTALYGGATLLRVHDIAETADIIKIFRLTREN